MANETELGNFNIPTDVLSRAMAPASVKVPVLLPLIHMEEVAAETPVTEFQIDGSLVAAAVSQSAAWSYGSGSELTQTSVTSTAAKHACVSKLTVEAQRFKKSSRSTVMQKQFEAILRNLEDTCLALTAGFSNSVTATDVLTVAKIMDAVYTVRSGILSAGTGKLSTVVDHKGLIEVVKELIQSGASVWSQSDMVSILRELDSPNGYAGSLPGTDVFEQNGLPTSGGDDIGLTFDKHALACQLDPTPYMMQVPVVSGGFWNEMAIYMFFHVVEWVDAAGCGLKSDT